MKTILFAALVAYLCLSAVCVLSVDIGAHKSTALVGSSRQFEESSILNILPSFIRLGIFRVFSGCK